MYNQYLVTVKEYAVGKTPKTWAVQAFNIKEARKIALKRIQIKKMKKKE